jgi:hypothetical protein
MVLTWLVGTPVTVVLTWWFWFRDRSSRELQKWRKTLFLFGLIATSLNVAWFAGWAVWLHFHYNPEAWKVQNVCGNIATYLCLAAFLASLLGKGRSRTSLGASAVLGFMLWVPIGIL